MAAALPPSLQAAAATESSVPFVEEEPTIYVHRKLFDHRCSVRILGHLILSHGSRMAVTVRELDHRVEVADVSVFTCVEVCSELIHNMLVEVCSKLINDMLAEAPATSEYDLSAGSWVEVKSICTPLDIAEAIARHVSDEFDDDMGVPAPGFQFDIHLPELRVIGGELCPICLLDVETEEEETLWLPCSHSFHRRCIATWFDQASTCPTCRRRFSVVRSASSEKFMYIR